MSEKRKKKHLIVPTKLNKWHKQQKKKKKTVCIWVSKRVMSNEVYIVNMMWCYSSLILGLNGDSKLFTRVAIVQRVHDQVLFRALVDFAIKRIN